jgi:phasin
MTDQWKREAKEMYLAAKNARIPENIQTIAEDSVAKSREAFEKLQAVSKDGTKTMETVMLTAQAGARAIGEKVMRNIEINADAAFDAAEAMARARTVPEFFQLQANFVQEQLNASARQAKDLLELSAKIAQQTFETANAATIKSFEQFKKSS